MLCIGAGRKEQHKAALHGPTGAGDILWRTRKIFAQRAALGIILLMAMGGDAGRSAANGDGEHQSSELLSAASRARECVGKHVQPGDGAGLV